MLFCFIILFIILLFIYLIFKVLLQLSIKYIILEHKTYTNKIVKYNNCIDTTKTLRTIRNKDEDLPINKIYLTAMCKDDLVIAI